MSQIGFVLAAFALSLVVVYPLRATQQTVDSCNRDPESGSSHRYPNDEYCATINYTNQCCHPFNTSGGFDRSLCTVQVPDGDRDCSCDIRCYIFNDCCSDVFCCNSKSIIIVS